MIKMIARLGQFFHAISHSQKMRYDYQKKLFFALQIES